MIDLRKKYQNYPEPKDQINLYLETKRKKYHWEKNTTDKEIPGQDSANIEMIFIQKNYHDWSGKKYQYYPVCNVKKGPTKKYYSRTQSKDKIL